MQQLTKLFNYLLLQTAGDVDEALKWLQYFAERLDIMGDGSDLDSFLDYLKRQHLIREDRGGHRLTQRGERRIREDALDSVFSDLRMSIGGDHPVPEAGRGVERLSETRPYQFGDPAMDVDFSSTIRNAIRREGLDFSITDEDLEVYETEHLTTSGTVLLLDISHSMVLYGEDRITPAKQVALALAELVKRKYPRDFFRVALFGDDAYEVSVDDLPYISVGPFHTNTQAALRLAQSMLHGQKSANKQIFMITDGKPSAIYDDDGLYINSMGLDPKIVNKTLGEAKRCRRDKITITTFMVTEDPYLMRFVNRLTQANRGRAYYASLDKLGEFVVEDFIRNRRRRTR